MLIMSISLSTNAQCNSDSLQIVLDQKIAEYNKAQNTLDSLNRIYKPLKAKADSIRRVFNNKQDYINYRKTEKKSELNWEVIGITTGTNVNKLSHSTKLWSNSDQIYISSSDQINYLEIFDYQGRKITTTKINNTIGSFYLGSKSNSLYIMVVSFQNGTKLTKKFTVNR